MFGGSDPCLRADRPHLKLSHPFASSLSWPFLSHFPTLSAGMEARDWLQVVPTSCSICASPPPLSEPAPTSKPPVSQLLQITPLPPLPVVRPTPAPEPLQLVAPVLVPTVAQLGTSSFSTLPLCLSASW